MKFSRLAFVITCLAASLEPRSLTTNRIILSKLIKNNSVQKMWCHVQTMCMVYTLCFARPTRVARWGQPRLCRAFCRLVYNILKKRFSSNLLYSNLNRPKSHKSITKCCPGEAVLCSGMEYHGLRSAPVDVLCSVIGSAIL